MTNENRRPRIGGTSMTSRQPASAGVNGVPGATACMDTTDSVVTMSAKVPVEVTANAPVKAPSEAWGRAQVRRRRLIQLVVLLVSFSLITGVAMAANLRRSERDADIVAPARTVAGADSGASDSAGLSGAASSSSDWTVRPLAIVHRGDDSAPENSLSAIVNAGARGADYSEIDVRLDADKVPVVFHDRRTGRLSADHTDVLVSDLTTSELQHMTMRQHNENFHTPTLAQAIEATQHINDHTGLLLDLKTDDSHAPALTDAVMAQIEDAKFADRTTLMSTSDYAISLIHKRRPDWSVGKCVSPVPGTPVDWPKDASFVVIRGDLINLSVLARARRDNISVFAGVNDDYHRGDTTLSLGADGILGSNARKVVKTVTRHEVRADDKDLQRLSGFPHR